MTLTRAKPEDLIGKRFTFDDLTEPEGRCECWEDPIPRAQYVLGLDFALGIPGRDWDTGCVFRRTKEPPYPQVFECQGHWGPNFDRIIYAVHRLYNECFVLGEANNTGTLILSKLFHEYGLTFMYGDRDEKVKGRKSLRRLGCWKGTGSIVLPKFRRAVSDRSVLIRSRPLLDQMGKLQFKARSTIDPGAVTDDDLRVKLAGGGSPDLVMAAAYAYHAIDEVQYFEEKAPEAPPGSIGDILGYNETWEPENTKGATWVPKRNKR